MKKIIIVFQIMLVSFYLGAQTISPEVIATAGDFYQNSGYSISWTLGEVVVETISGTNLTLTQGFQQPDYSFSEIYEQTDVNYRIKVYPNPVENVLLIETIENIDFEIIMIDMNGKIVFERKLIGSTEINLTDFAKGTYLLNIFTKDHIKAKTYKIQKIK